MAAKKQAKSKKAAFGGILETKPRPVVHEHVAETENVNVKDESTKKDHPLQAIQTKIVVEVIVPELITREWLESNNYRIAYNPNYPGGFRLIEK